MAEGGRERRRKEWKVKRGVNIARENIAGKERGMRENIEDKKMKESGIVGDSKGERMELVSNLLLCSSFHKGILCHNFCSIYLISCQVFQLVTFGETSLIRISAHILMRNNQCIIACE